MAGQRQRFYHRFIREQDLPDLEAASAYLFAFDAHELSLKDIISSDRWFCLAAVASSGAGSERIVGFVAAALGSITEFPQEAQYLQAALPPTASTTAGFNELESSSTSDSCAAVLETAGSSSSGSSGGDALALEVVLLGVVPEFRRRGVASRLIKQVKTHAQTRGASLLFLHVQSSNNPARQLYSKAGFSAAAVLPGYYSNQLAQRGQLGWQQQQQHDAGSDSSSSSDLSSTLPSEFSGSDAELLVMRLDSTTAAALQGASDSSSSEELITAGSSSSSSTASAAATSTEEVLPTDATAASGPGHSYNGYNWAYTSKAAWPPQQTRSSQNTAAAKYQSLSTSSSSSSNEAASKSSSSSSSSKSGAASVTAEGAAEAVTAAAAAAARLLLGPAIGLLGFAPKGQGRKGSGFTGPRGELVQVGGEWMVQVRAGRDVVMYDPEELPADVLLSDRDKAVLQQQRVQQQELLAAVLQRQQQQQAAVGANEQEVQTHDSDIDDHDDTDGHNNRGGGSSSTTPEQQQQQQPAAAGLPPRLSAWQASWTVLQQCQLHIMQQQQQYWIFGRQQHLQCHQQQQQQDRQRLQWLHMLPAVQKQCVCKEAYAVACGRQQRQLRLPGATVGQQQQQLQRHPQPVLAALHERTTCRVGRTRQVQCRSSPGYSSRTGGRQVVMFHRVCRS